MNPIYLDHLQALWSDPATHQVALAFLFLWFRIEALHRKHSNLSTRVMLLEQGRNPPALALAKTR